MTFHVETKHWPLVLVEFTGEQTAEDFRGYLQALVGLLDRRERFVMFTDSGDSFGIPAGARAELGKIIEDRTDDFERYLQGHAVLIRSPLQRGIFTALNWITSMPGSVRAFGKRRDALDWLRERWEKSTGSPIPAMLL